MGALVKLHQRLIVAMRPEYGFAARDLERAHSEDACVVLE
jgi:hypothetical protein